LFCFRLSYFLSSGISGALNIYYAQYILHNPALVGVLSLAGLVPIIVGMVLSAPLIKKVGKRNAALIGAFVSLAGALLVLVDPSNFQILIIGTVLKTLGTAPAVATGAAMLADTVEYGEWKTGARTEGLIFSGSGLAPKIGSGLGGAIVGWALAMGGYIGGLETQSDSAISAINVLFIYVPIILAALQMALMWIYTLDKKFSEIMSELQNLSK
jgi:GPH family glycoside/pentoside/hexuronide:cation symporter